MPYQRKEVEGPLTSVTPLVNVSRAGCGRCWMPVTDRLLACRIGTPWQLPANCGSTAQCSSCVPCGCCAPQMYKSTGLIGLMGTTTSGSSAAAAAADALTQRLQALASATDDKHLAAAKQLALGGYQSAISGRAGMVQDMGLQLLARGKFSAQEYASAVSGLTSADVSKYVGEVLKSPLTLVAVGALANLPKYDTVAGRLRA
jgi:hypothetical protein